MSTRSSANSDGCGIGIRDDIRILDFEVSAYLDVGDYDKVLHSCLHILKLDPQHQNALELLHTLGHDHVRELLEEDKHRQAVQFLESFIQVEATYPPFYILLGRAYLERDNIAKAEKVLAQRIELEEDKNPRARTSWQSLHVGGIF